MPKPRDPLSAEFDQTSERFLEICEDDLYGWHTLTLTSPAGDPVDAGGLTAHERALQRSLYYVLNSTGAEGPLGGRWVKNEARSLQRVWGSPAYGGNPVSRLLRIGRRRRVLTARLVTGRDAFLYVQQEVPPGRQYTANPALQAQAQALGE